MGKQHYIISLTILFAIVFAAEHYLPTLGISPQDDETKYIERDFFLTDMNTTVLHADGKPHYTVKAHAVSHYPQDSTIEMKDVDLSWFESKSSTWHITSNLAQLDSNRETIHLSGKVNVVRPATNQSSEQKLITEKLHIYPKKSYAETDVAVTIVSGKSHVTGIGMRMYMNEGRIELLSSTKAEYNVSK